MLLGLGGDEAMFHSKERGVTLAMRASGQGQGSTSILGLQCDHAADAELLKLLP